MNRHRLLLAPALVALWVALASCAPGLSPGPAVPAVLVIPAPTATLVQPASVAPPAAAATPAPLPTPAPAAGLLPIAAFEGVASWYGPGFAGRRTASGEIFDPQQLTAAHRSLPFGTMVRVTNLDNGRSVMVRINDRGPFSAGRVIDLSRAAAEEIQMIGSGLAAVRVEGVGAAAGAVRLAVAPDLRGFEVRSAHHRPGELLVLASEQLAEAIVVRVVPGETSSAADLFVAPELFLALGPIGTLRFDEAGR